MVRRPSWMVGRPSLISGVVGRHTRMSGSVREALPDVREWPGEVGRPSRMVGLPSLMTRSGREALPGVRE